MEAFSRRFLGELLRIHVNTVDAIRHLRLILCRYRAHVSPLEARFSILGLCDHVAELHLAGEVVDSPGDSLH